MAADRKAFEKRIKPPKQERKPKVKRDAGNSGSGGLTTLQRQVGNRAVQRLLVQRSGGRGAFPLSGEMVNRLHQERSGGRPLEGSVHRKMGEAMGHDFSEVRVHTDAQADKLSRQLHARAFTVGQHVFFRAGAYDSSSSAGGELLAHELTHVVDQRQGKVQSEASQTTVHAPDDIHEQRANAVARQVTAAPAGVQRAYIPGEGMTTRPVQRQEEEELQGAVQRQEEEEEELQPAVQRQEEEEEEMQMAVQRQEEEEEEMQMAVQRQEEEEELQGAIQRQEEEEEELQPAVQRQEEEEEEMQMAVQGQEEEELQMATGRKR